MERPRERALVCIYGSSRRIELLNKEEMVRKLYALVDNGLDGSEEDIIGHFVSAELANEARMEFIVRFFNKFPKSRIDQRLQVTEVVVFENTHEFLEAWSTQ